MKMFMRYITLFYLMTVASFAFASQGEMRIVKIYYQIYNSEAFMLESSMFTVSSKPVPFIPVVINKVKDKGDVLESKVISDSWMLPVVKDGYIYLNIRIKNQTIPLFLKSEEDRTVNFCMSPDDCNYYLRLKISV